MRRVEGQSIGARRRGVLMASVGIACLLGAGVAMAEIPAKGVTIGVLSDMSGPFADLSGPGSLAATQLAVEEFGGTVGGKPITVISADHQNKPDVAAVITRKWFDEDGVHAVIDFPNSGTALAAQEIARDRKRIALFTSTGTTALTGKACSPYGFHWMYDTYSNSVGLVGALAERGLKSFYFVTVDYAFGQAMENDFRKALDGAGLKIVGGTKVPVNTADMSSAILAAQGSGAQAIIMAAAGQDNINGIKTAREFGVGAGGQVMVVPAAMLTDIKAMGLTAAQGAVFVDSFYWNMDDKARRFGRRFQAKTGKMPTMGQAGAYSATLHYLKAIKNAETVDADAVAARMRATVVNDDVVRDGRIRADGRLVKDMYVVEVKAPAESTEAWDLEKVIATIPAEKAFRPLSQSECPLVK